MLIAIYSRKSKWTGKGDSVENQGIMCREYIEKWIEGGEGAEILEYEDEGFSGKNGKRPRFQQMLRDMRERHFDYLVCYKLDRLGRNLADLASLMESLEREGTSFVSIKERFDTTTPIGKAMLYFSGVLAQMEREQIAERVRDNMLLLARTGRWLGGNTPLGFIAEKRQREAGAGKKRVSCYLVENPGELELVKFIYSYFMERQSLTKVVEYLAEHHIKTRNGREFYISGVRDILTNPVYCTADREAYAYFYELGCQICVEEEELDGETGLMSYGKTSSGIYKNKAADYGDWIISRGRHKGMVSGRDYVRIQEILRGNREKGEGFRSTGNNTALLTGLIRCTCGHRMRPKNYPVGRVNQRGEQTFAYLCSHKERTHGRGCQVKNVHGNTLDEAVCRELFPLVAWSKEMIPLLEELQRKIKGSVRKPSTEGELLIREYERKKEQIGKLIDSIKREEKNQVSGQYIHREIEKLDRECKELLEKMEEAQSVCEKGRKEEQWEEMESSYLDFSKFFQKHTVPEKR